MSTLFEFAPTGSIANGSAVAPNSSVYDTVDAGVVYNTAVKFKDLVASAKADNSAGTTVRTLEQVFPAPVLTRRIVRVMQVSAITGSTFCQLSRWKNGSSGQGAVRVSSTGKIVLRDEAAATSLATSTASVTFGSPFRFEVDIVEQPGATPDTVTLRLYLDPQSAVPDATLGPFSYTGGAFDRITDGAGTAAASTIVHVLYAADGDTANPSLDRWAAAGSGEGIRTYIVSGGAEVLITSTTI